MVACHWLPVSLTAAHVLWSQPWHIPSPCHNPSAPRVTASEEGSSENSLQSSSSISVLMEFFCSWIRGLLESLYQSQGENLIHSLHTNDTRFPAAIFRSVKISKEAQVLRVKHPVLSTEEQTPPQQNNHGKLWGSLTSLPLSQIIFYWELVIFSKWYPLKGEKQYALVLLQLITANHQRYQL